MPEGQQGWILSAAALWFTIFLPVLGHLLCMYVCKEQEGYNTFLTPVFKFPHYQYFMRAPDPQRSLQISKPTQHSWGQRELIEVTTQLSLIQYLGKGNEVKLFLYKTATCRERSVDEWMGASNYSNSQKQGLK